MIVFCRQQSAANLSSLMQGTILSSSPGCYDVPKYFCPKWLGATGWTSDVKIDRSGNFEIIAFAAGKKQ